MDLLCERCRSVIDTEPCPVCGGMEIRPPEAEDLCRLTTLDGPRTEILSDTLERAGIPFRLVSATNRYHLYRTFFVPYEHFDDAFNIDRELWRTPEPMADDLFESAPGLFTGDEIDRMEDDQLL